MARQLNLFESATKRARIQRQGTLVQITIDGGGAMVVFTQEFVQVQKWAQSKAASQNQITDTGRFLTQFSVMVSRPGSILGTQGSNKLLEGLVRAMKQGGYDINEWSLSPDQKNVGNVMEPTPPKAKPKADTEDEAPVGEDAPKPD